MNIQIAQFSVLSESGRRPHNEDAVYPNSLENATNIPNLYIVADGIGGKGKGDAASRITIESFAQYFAENPPAEEALNRVYIDNALRFTENAFDEYIKIHPECWGMGATIVLLYANTAGVSIAWAGNCRAYQYRKAEQLYRSNDHTEVNVLLRDGRITAEEAQTHARRHSILRAIQGSSYPTQMDTHFIGKEAILPNDIFFLCSDGILEGVSESHLSTAIDLQSNTELLLAEIKTYCQAESSDNYACVLLRMEDKDAVAVAPVIAPPVVSTVSSPVLWDDDDDDNQVALSVESSRDVEVGAEVETEIEVELEVETPPLVVNETPLVVAPPIVVNTPAPPVVETPPVVTPPQVETPYIQPPLIPTPSVSANNNNTIPPASGNHLREEKKDNSGVLALGVLVFTGILVALLAWAWTGSGKNTGEKSYEDYMQTAQENQKVGNYDSALVNLDRAIKVNKGASDNDSRLRIELVEKKRAADKGKMLAQGDKFAAFNKYPDYIRAINVYEDAKRNYGDNGGIIQGKIDKVHDLMGKAQPAAAFQELLVEANNACREGNTLDANVFMEAAIKFKSTPEQQKNLTELRGQCNILADAAKKAGKVEPTVAANERGLQEKTSPATSTSTEAASKKVAAPEVTKTRGANSSKEVVESGAIASNTTNTASNARKAAPSIVSPNMTNLQKGKAYFRDANDRKNCDSYIASLNALEKSYASKELDGEGAYMAAIICHDGHCSLKNAAKALEYANKSAFLSYANGQYLYAKLLLNKKSHSDSIIAKGLLTKASAQGQADAKALQQKMWKKK